MNTNSSDNPPAAAAAPKKRRTTSIPFLIAALVLGVGAYYAGPTVMTYYFLWEEQGKVPRIPYIADNIPELPPTSTEGGNRGVGGSEERGPSTVDRAKRRPKGEFEEESKPSGDATTPPVPKT